MTNQDERPEVICKCGRVNRINRARTRMTCWCCTKCYAPLYWVNGKPVGWFKDREVALKLAKPEKLNGK